MVALNEEGFEYENLPPPSPPSTYLVLGRNNDTSSRIDFLSNAPSDYDLKHQVVCIRFDSRVALEKVLDGFRNLSDYSVSSISHFVDTFQSTLVHVDREVIPFQVAFRNQYKVLWQRTS
jgi:hypothetical protein